MLRFVDVSSDLLAQGYGIRFRAGGGSMAPAIGDGDVITVKPLEPASLTTGRVIVYRDRHRVVAHRIVSTSSSDHPSPHVLVVRGDAARECDPPVAPSQVLGEVVAVSRYATLRFLALTEGLRPSDSPTRSLARRFAGSLAMLARVLEEASGVLR